MGKDTYNDIVEHYKNKNNLNKKETFAVESAKGVFYVENVKNNENISVDIKEKEEKNNQLKTNCNLNNTEDKRQLENKNKENQLKKEENINLETKEKSKKDNRKTNYKKSKKKDIETNTLEEDSTERKKRISIKKLALNIFTICIIAVVCGYLLGNAIISKVYMSVDYGKFSESTLRNTDEEIAEWQKKKYSELTPTQIFVVAENKLETLDYYQVIGKGTIKNSFKNQGVNVKFYKNYDQYYCENGSTGFISTVSTYFYDGKSVNSYKGTPKDDGKTEWKSKKNYSREEFKELNGNDVSSFLYYLVSTNTVTDSQYIGRVNKDYKYKLRLTVDSSIVNYVKQMKYMSGIDSPVFNLVEFEFVVDENFNLKEIVTHDIYVVNYVALVTCEGSLTFTYSYNEPELEIEPEVE